jgi:predicted HTH domain antitoxin
MMARITFDVPESALSTLRLSPNDFVREMRVAAALLWYSRGEVSHSVGAAIAGVSRAEFIDELARRRISVVQATIEELQEEMRRE